MAKEFSDVREELKHLRPGFDHGLFVIPGLPEPLENDLFIENLMMNTVHRLLKEANLKGFLIKLIDIGGYLFLPAPKIDFVVPILYSQSHSYQNLEDQLSLSSLTAKGIHSKALDFCLLVEFSAQTNHRKLTCIEFKGSDKYSLLYDPKKHSIKPRLLGEKAELKQVTGFKGSDDASVQLSSATGLSKLFHYMSKNKRVDMGSKTNQDFLGEVLTLAIRLTKGHENTINRLTVPFVRNSALFNQKFPSFMNQLETIPSKFNLESWSINKMEFAKNWAGILIQDWLEFMNFNSLLKIRTDFDVQLLIQEDQLALFVRVPGKADKNSPKFYKHLQEALTFVIRELRPAFKFFLLGVVGVDLKRDLNGLKKPKHLVNVDDAVQEILEKHTQFALSMIAEDKNQIKKSVSEFNQKISDLELSPIEREIIGESDILESISLVANFSDKTQNRWFSINKLYKIEQQVERKELGVRAGIQQKFVPIFRQLYSTIALTYEYTQILKIEMPLITELNTQDFSKLAFPIDENDQKVEHLVGLMLTSGFVHEWEKLLKAKKNEHKERTIFLGCTYRVLMQLKKLGIADAIPMSVSETMRRVFEDEFAADTSRNMCDFFFEIVKTSSTQKFCDLLSWFFDVIGENVRSIIANKVSELVYDSCRSHSAETVQWAVNFSKQVGNLEEQLGKIYPDDNTLLTLLCRQKDSEPKALEIILHAGFPEEILLYKVEGKNALAWARESGNSKVEQVLLGKRIFESPEKDQINIDQLIQLQRELSSKSPQFKQLVTEIEQLQKDTPNCWTDSLRSKSTSLLELLSDIQLQLKSRKLIPQQPKETSDTLLTSFARLQKLHGFLRVKAKILKEQQKVGELGLTKGEEKHFTKVLESVENDITRLRTDLSQ